MDERREIVALQDLDSALVDAYIAGAFEAVTAVRNFYETCPECGSDDHDGCLLFDGPEISREEFSAYALSSLLCAAGGF